MLTFFWRKNCGGHKKSFYPHKTHRMYSSYKYKLTKKRQKYKNLVSLVKSTFNIFGKTLTILLIFKKDFFPNMVKYVRLADFCFLFPYIFFYYMNENSCIYVLAQTWLIFVFRFIFFLISQNFFIKFFCCFNLMSSTEFLQRGYNSL